MALSRISGTTGIVDGSITSAKLADFSAAVDLNGVELILDADADTSISADTDDQIDIKIANADHLKILSSSGDTVFKPMVDAKDIIFQQFDGNKVFEINDGNFVSVGGNATAAGQIRIYEDTDNGSHYSGFTVGNLTASVAYQLPDADGSSGQALITDGSGVLSFTTLSANTPSSADGQALGSASLEWSDLFLADGGTIQFGNDQEVTLTHVADTGLLLSATDQLQFGDSGTYIHQSADGVLDLVSDTEIELNATTIDVNGNLDVSGTITSGGIVTGTGFTAGSAVLAEAELELLDGLTAGTAIASKVVTTDANIDSTGMRNLTISGEIDAATGDFSGVVDIAGATTTAAITASGIIKTDDTTNATSTTDGSLQTDGGLSVNLDAVIGDDLFMKSDAAVIHFGADSDVTITHTPDKGLVLKSLATGDDSRISLTLQSGETDIAVNDIIAKIDFQAPDEGAGTDAILVAAGIEAVSEGDFSASNNATKLSFKTAASESATEKMSLSSAGLLTIADDLIIGDGKTIGSASDPDAITIASNGQLTLTQTLIGTALDISGDIDVDGTTNLDVVDIDGAVDMASTLQVDGSITSSDGMTITVADNSNTLELISTDNDTAEGPILAFNRSVSDVAAGDLIGTIKFLGEDDAGNAALYHEIQASIEDGSNGGEDGRLTIYQSIAGATKNVLDFKSGEIVFNQDSVDLDFRVESNGKTHAIFVDAGNDHVCINTSDDLGGDLNVDGGIVVQNGSNADQLTLISTDQDANVGPRLRLYRNSSSPADNDIIGDIRWEGKDSGGNDFMYGNQKVTIHQEADGSEDSMMQFFVALGGSSINVLTLDRAGTIFNEDSNDIDFRVESNGNANMIKVDAGDDRTHYGGTSYQGMSLGVHNFHSGTTTDQAGLVIGSNSASYANNILKIATLRDQNNSYNFIAAFSGNGSDNLDDDLEFRAKGDGNVLCDESFTGSGADYSEYFEWNDGNSSDVDRVGLSVKLSGNKIVASTGSDDAADIIGVVSGSPVIVGDADGTGTRWTEKYLKDDYGRRIMEEFTVTSWRDEANKTDHSYATDRIPSDITAPDDATVTTTEEDGSTKLLRRKLNPDYNSSLTYVARADRKEWDTVGLVGKLRMKKDQKTGTNWIKLRDISDTVEEWLVR